MKIFLLLPLLALVSCGGSGDRYFDQPDTMEAEPASAPAAQAPGGADAAKPSDAAIRAGQADSTAQPSAAPSMLIRTGTASVEVDSVEEAMARVQRMTKELGGYVGGSTLAAGDEQVRSVRLELKIPATRFEQAINGLRPVGKVESVQVEAQDVGEEFVDLTARNANARRLEARLQELLATRTGRLEDVLAVERELARVRQEIDSQEGRLRYLRARVAMSTLNVTLHEPVPEMGAYPGYSPIRESFGEARRNFIGFIAGFIASLGFLVPLAVILAFLAWVWGRWRRRRRLAPAAAPARENAP